MRNVDLNHDLAFGLHWDRDYSVNIARMCSARLIYLPIGTFLLHPAVLFIVLTKSSMSTDYKVGYICNTVIEMCFDIYNCLLHQMYILAPYPIIMCTGLLCVGAADPVVLAFWTAAMSFPFMYLMFRMHQSSLYSTNPFHVSARAQALALLFVAATLFANVLAVHHWTIDIPGKWELLKSKDIAWARNYTANFIVLGEDIGDVGPFKNISIAIVTMLFDFSLFNFLTFHAIYNLRKNTVKLFSKLGNGNISKAQLTPPTHQAQLRLIYSLTIQASSLLAISIAIVSLLFFISPQIVLFFGLTSGREFWVTRPKLAAVLRLLSLIFFSLAPLANSIIFLARDPWCRKCSFDIFAYRASNRHFRCAQEEFYERRLQIRIHLVQALALIFVAGTLFFNVLAVHRWTIDIPGKWELLKRNDVAWAHNYSSNFLVLGGEVGDVGPYKKLTIVAGTMLFDSSLFNFLTFNAIYNLRKNTVHGRWMLGNKDNAPESANPANRSDFFVFGTIDFDQVIVCSLMFISPQILLFYGLTSGRDFCETWPTVAAVLRLFSQIFFSLAPLARSLIFLASMSDCDLVFGLHWDRDYSVDIARTARLVYLPIGIFIVHPTVIYILLTKSSMSADYKFGYICHKVLEMCFDVYNCLFYQMYILAPFPIIMCTGLLCDNTSDPANLLVILTFWTAAVCLPYMFLMLRMHQCALYTENPFKVSARAQGSVLLLVAATLFSNVLATHLWTIDIARKWELLTLPSSLYWIIPGFQQKDVVWAQNFTSNFLVLGREVGDTGPFKNGSIHKITVIKTNQNTELFIIIGTILIDFSIYDFLALHAIYNLGKHSVRNHLTPHTRQAQLRLIYSLTIQAIVSAIFFMSPLVLLFVGLNSGREYWENHSTLAAVFRLLFLMFFSLSPLSNSLIFLARDPWCRKILQRRRSSVSSLSLGQPILPTSDMELIAARNRQLKLKRTSLP
uniref:G protein-coupled receptor n=1 Tax=Pristionchus pacificus TaxID=54126 RepID=A0A8R1UVK6_PRIPA